MQQRSQSESHREGRSSYRGLKDPHSKCGEVDFPNAAEPAPRPQVVVEGRAVDVEGGRECMLTGLRAGSERDTVEGSYVVDVEGCREGGLLASKVYGCGVMSGTVCLRPPSDTSSFGVLPLAPPVKRDAMALSCFLVEDCMLAMDCEPSELCLERGGILAFVDAGGAV